MNKGTIMPQSPILRDYQDNALAKVVQGFGSADRLLVSHATGLGKTYMGAYFAALWPELAEGFGRSPRVLWLAHRDELIQQTAEHYERFAGRWPGIEMGSQSVGGRLHVDNPLCVVSSVQTLFQETRRANFTRDDFGLVILDESHHYVAPEFQKVYEYFVPPAKAILLTATTDRADEVSLGAICDDVADHIDVLTGIERGWLVRPRQEFIQVGELDWSELYASADLPAEKLDTIIREEGVLHKIVKGFAEAAKGRQTLVFTPRVESARLMVPVIERYLSCTAGYVHGGMPLPERRQVINAYREGEIQVLCNAMILTEGADFPATSCVVLARPTRSRMLYSQIAGRGLRPLPGVVDGLESAEERIAAIAASAKPDCYLVDLVGCTQRLKLMQGADLLGGKYDELVLQEAYRRIQEKTQNDVAPDILEELLASAAKEADLRAAERARVIAEAKLNRKTTNPFDVFCTLDLAQQRMPGWFDVQASEKQRGALEAAGIKCEGAVTRSEAKQLLDEITRRHAKGLCSYRQARQLMFRGFTTIMTFDQAWAAMEHLKARPGGMKKGKEDFARLGAAKKRGRAFGYNECSYLPRYMVPEGAVVSVQAASDAEWTVNYETKKRNHFQTAKRDSDGHYYFTQAGHTMRVRWQDVTDLKATAAPLQHA